MNRRTMWKEVCRTGSIDCMETKEIQTIAEWNECNESGAKKAKARRNARSSKL
jgi:hypothetical protein